MEINIQKEAYHYPKVHHKNYYSGHTICVLVVDGFIFMGESYCNPTDQFSKKIGKTMAKERALEAVKRYLAKKV